MVERPLCMLEALYYCFSNFFFLGGLDFLLFSHFCKKPGVQIQVDCSTVFAKTIPLLLLIPFTETMSII